MKLMILDGNSIVNRAFFGVRPLTTRDGLNTNAVYGFLNILLKLMDEEKPDSLCVAFDLKGPTFRHKMYEGYKAKRHAMPEELAEQMPVLKQVLEAMNIPRLELEGYEADDIIGTVSRICEEAGADCLIVTGDKDSFQLIGPHSSVKHVRSRMGQTETITYDTARFQEEYGFEPPKMVDLKALMGDASDNIPGVAGIGEKTALDLIRRFGTVAEIYRDPESMDVKPGVRKKLEEGRDMAELSYTLALIDRQAPVDFSVDCCPVAAPDNDRLIELFDRLEFTKLTERLGLMRTEKAPEAAPVQYEIREITDQKGLEGLIEEAAGWPFACVACSDGTDELVLAHEGIVLHMSRESWSGDWNEALKALFAADIKKAGHDIKDIMRGLLDAGAGTDGWVYDSALAAYLLDPTGSGYELEKLTERWCGYSLPGTDKTRQMSLLDEGDRREKLAAEACAVEALKAVFDPMLSEQRLESLLNDIELPLCPVLAEMERTGFLADRQALGEFSRWLARGIDELQKNIYEQAGEEFNINSPKQLGTVLFEKLMLPPPKKTKTGYSTNIEVLEKLKSKHPIIPMIMEYRELTKLRSTYAEGLVKYIDPDGRIRTSFQMTVTATGRLSSTDPNLQNIPIRRELGGEIRRMFTAAPGNLLVDADYSQVELRLLAHMSGDEHMREAFINGEDIHRTTAARVFGVPFEEVTPLQRSRAKAVNFGIVYGISQFSLSQDIGVSVAEARRYMDSYFEKYSGVRDYMKNVVETAKKDGYVCTLYGRRRALPELKSSNFNTRSFGERVALNMPIQGTAADIMKIAMIRVHRRLKAEGLRAKLILQVHDELIAECPEEEAEAVMAVLKEEMEAAAQLSIPLTAEAKCGKNWHEAK
ncbi:MAG: DNA polymerase I [Oscillospiraceae bacterium]|nr:DNA polymerase I [Oscillospiraceae bacterium]